ncbi:unnamed protein product [Ostreobium quekettii]|uniref:dolichol kinase n=1 Tax=Ostreobium quekettii TaxID=121088 RepID=A0A8S1J2H5_9CHLO|nr:unnamed protein product [Ostreobium quekettii]|eukprot:evm.model.scf_1928.1 EVM.evm.TU.scf_1928.1   scf_1928:4110-7771(+)
MVLFASRARVEVLIVAATTLKISATLASAPNTGELSLAWALCLLVGLATFQEFHVQALKTATYFPRPSDSHGLAQGAAALPWVFSSLMLVDGSRNGYSSFPLRCTLVSSSLVLALLLLLPSGQAGTPDQGLASDEADATGKVKKHNDGECNADSSDRCARVFNAKGGLLLSRIGLCCAYMVVAGLALTSNLSAKLESQIENTGFYSPAADATTERLVHSGSSDVGRWPLPQSPGLAPVTVLLATALLAGITFHALLKRAKFCFTIGEAIVVGEASALLVSKFLGLIDWNALALRDVFSIDCLVRNLDFSTLQATSNFVVVLLTVSIAILVPAAGCLRCIFRTPDEMQLEGSMLLLVLCWVLVVILSGVGCVLAGAPAICVLKFAFFSGSHRLVMGWWVFVLVGGLLVAGFLGQQQTTHRVILRKWFHILAVVLFLPAEILAPKLLHIALAIALVLLMLLEAIRFGCVPILGPAIHQFMAQFTDVRDCGPIIWTHASLLIGMAAPLWMAPLDVNAGTDASGTILSSSSFLPLCASLSGIVSLGVGDAFAAIVGTRYGRMPLCSGTKKTVEGTTAGVLSMLAVWWALGWVAGRPAGEQLSLTFVSLATGLFEATSTQLDNIFLPLHCFALLNMCSISSGGPV